MSASENNKGSVIVISGPSGVGKSTICKEIVSRMDNVFLSVSTTTRPKGKLEVDGKDYWFVTKEEFQKRLDNDMFLEHAEVFGNIYGTPRDKVDEALNAGKNIILEIDVQGARQAKAIYKDAIMIFILPPSQKELANRMNGRGREDAESAEDRLNGAGTEIAAAWQYYEYMVINDDLEQAINEVMEIIQQRTGEQ